MDRDRVNTFENLLLSTKREGIDGLLEFIRKSDFYTAPASTRFHLSREGGLLEHSLNVYDCLRKKAETEQWKDILPGSDSIIIASLLHDLCKTYYYGVEMRNKKIDGSWQSVPTYVVDNKIPYGHGEKSVMMIEEYIKLKPVERYAIRWHMGFSEPKELYNDIGKAFEKYPLAIALHEADLEATYIYEKEQ